MAEPNNQQLGDGGDNPSQAAQQIAKAAKQAASTAGKTAATGASSAAGAAAANATAAAVNASVNAGQAAANIAVGTAAGGPWGAIIAAAWSMRHTLFKILICVCFALLFIIILITNLPSVMFDYMFGAGNTAEPGRPVGITRAYSGLSDVVQGYVLIGHDKAMTQVQELIRDGGYDYDASMEALIDVDPNATDADVCYILSAYSVLKEQRNASVAELEIMLEAATDTMFSVSGVPKEKEKIIPITYTVYRPVSLVVVTEKTRIGAINGVPQYRYTTAAGTYYLPDKEETTDTLLVREAYRPVTLELPVYSGSGITGTTYGDYYQITGTQTLMPQRETVEYLECTVSSLNKAAILSSFGLDADAFYGNYSITNAQAIENMSHALTATLFGGTN